MATQQGKKPFAPSYASLTIWLFFLLLAFYVTVTRGHFWSTDEVDVYQQTRSLWENGDLHTPPLPNTLPGRDGRYYAVYGAGQSFLALPLYGLERRAVRLGAGGSANMDSNRRWTTDRTATFLPLGRRRGGLLR